MATSSLSLSLYLSPSLWQRILGNKDKNRLTDDSLVEVRVTRGGRTGCDLFPPPDDEDDPPPDPPW